MNDIKTGIATLITSAITSKSYPLPAGFDIDEAYKTIKRHHITTLAYVGAVNCGVPKTAESMQQMFRRYFEEIEKSERQQKEIRILCDIFEKNGIDYMCLKGTNMKPLYPAPELRKMGDVDILVREADYPRVEKLLESLDYQNISKYDHHLSWTKNKVLFEIHIRVMSRWIKYYSYFGDGWQRAKKLSGHCFTMRPEDEYIFLFIHFVKHYCISGIGFRHITDLWVFRKSHPGLDDNYISNELEKLDLVEFHKNVLQTVLVMFDNQQPTEATEIISDYIFNSGSWGTLTSKSVAKGADLKVKNSSKNARLQMILYVLFLPYSGMRVTYPILEKYPVLLPFYWVKRAFDVLRLRRKNVGVRFKEISITTPERVTAYESAMKKVGLNYAISENFKGA